MKRFQKNVHIVYKMAYYISEGINVNKTSTLREYIICHCWNF